MTPQNSVPPPGSRPAPLPSAMGTKTANKVGLSLEASGSGSAVVLHCEGRILFRSQANALSAMVAETLPRAERMVVNLAGVDSIDSAGLGELVLTHLWAQAAGYALKFASPKKSVRRLLESTNVASVFDLYASVPQAIAAMVHEEVQAEARSA